MKKVIKNFFIDRLIYIVFMIINSLLLALFYTFTVGERVEIIYPITITIFLIITLLSIDWFRYVYFNKTIEEIKKGNNYSMKVVTREQKEVAKAFNNINLRHVEKEENILSEYENKIYFLSGAIHKFKNYISVIGLIIENTKGENIELYKPLKDIEYENDNLCSSLDQVLNYIRLDSFSNDFEVIAINLFDEIKDIINENKNAFINSGIFPVLICEDKDSLIITDKKWNKVIIEQVIRNSIKYSNIKEENKKIYFEITNNVKNIILSIKDEGIGIQSYDLKKVFEPFFTGENGRKIRNSTGIGLYLAKEVAFNLGHEISINSEVNVGTEFTIEYLSKM